MPSFQGLYLIADELRAIASQGLAFTEGAYDRERYEKILKASARIVAALEDESPEEIEAQYRGNLFHVSPVVTAEAAVLREGKILLIQRSDNGLWALPGGLADVGESPAEAAGRELWEEAGVHGKVTRLLGIFDSRRWEKKTRMQLTTILFLAETDEIPALHPTGEGAHASFQETLAVDFFDENHLPALHGGHTLRVPLVFKMVRGEIPTPYFDS